MLLTSCNSTKIRYIEKPFVPEISFPTFPVLTEVERNDDGTVSVKEEWLVRLAEYKVLIEETEKNYKELKALYEK